MRITFNKVKKGIELLVSIPKSFYVSWRLTSFRQAFHLPVLCRYNVKILSTGGRLLGGGADFGLGLTKPGFLMLKTKDRCSEWKEYWR